MIFCIMRFLKMLFSRTGFFLVVVFSLLWFLLVALSLVNYDQLEMSTPTRSGRTVQLIRLKDFTNILNISQSLEELDENIFQMRNSIEDIEKMIWNVFSNYSLYNDFTPRSPSSFSMNLTPQLLPKQGFLTCFEMARLEYAGSTKVKHNVAQTRKVFSLDSLYIHLSLEDSPALSSCINRQMRQMNVHHCYREMHHKLITEAVYRQRLNHHMIANVSSACVTFSRTVFSGPLYTYII